VAAALKSGFDLDRRFNLGILRLLSIKFLLSEYPFKGTGIELAHAPDVWPDFPQSRSRNTGLVHGPHPSQPDEAGLLSKLMRPALELAASWRRQIRGKDIFIYALRNTVPRFRLVQSVAVEPNATAVLDRVAQGNPNEAVIEAGDAICSVNKHSSSGAAFRLYNTLQTKSSWMSITANRVSWLLQTRGVRIGEPKSMERQCH